MDNNVKQLNSMNAWIINSNGRIYLQSYSTIVLSLDENGKDLKRHWEGFTRTTCKQIGVFLRKYGLCYYDYKALPVVEI